MKVKKLQQSQFAVLMRKKPHLGFLLEGKSASIIGSSLYNLALLTLASQQKDPALAISLVSLLGYLPDIIDPFTAYLSDREEKHLKKGIQLSFVQALIYLVTAVFLLDSQLPFALFIVVVLANVSSDILDNYIIALQNPLIKRWVASDELRLFSSASTIIRQICSILGKLLGVFWLMFYPQKFATLSVLNAMTFLLCAYFLRRIKVDGTLKNTERAEKISLKDFGIKMQRAYHQIKTTKLLNNLIMMALVNFILASFSLLRKVALDADQNLHFGSYSQTLFTLELCFFIGLLTGSFLRPKWLEALSYAELLVIMIGIITVSVIDCLFYGPLWIVLLAQIAFASVMGYLVPKFSAEMIEMVPEEELARVASLTNFVLLFAPPLGSLQATLLLYFFSLKLAWIVELVLLTSGMLLLGYFVLQKRKEDLV